MHWYKGIKGNIGSGRFKVGARAKGRVEEGVWGGIHDTKGLLKMI